MNPELNYSNSEKEKIGDWKQSLPLNSERRFTYSFVENGKRCEEGYKLYDFEITSNDNFKLTVAKNIEL